MNSLPIFLVTFIPMVAWGAWLRQRFARSSRRVLGEAAAYYFVTLFFLPGVILHEVTHWLAAWVLGAQPTKIRVWPTVLNGRRVAGYVLHKRVGWLRDSLIGLAPLLGGTLALYVLSRRAFEIVNAVTVLESGDLRKILIVVWLMMSSVDLWLWLYLIFSVANTMLPSPVDRAAWLPTTLGLACLCGGIVLLGGQAFLSAWASSLDIYVRWMAILSAITLLIDIPFWLVIKVIETLGA